MFAVHVPNQTCQHDLHLQKPKICGHNKRTWGDKEGVWRLWWGGWGTFSTKCLRASRTSWSLNLEKGTMKKRWGWIFLEWKWKWFSTSSMSSPACSSRWRPCSALATPWLKEAGAELLWGLIGLSTWVSVWMYTFLVFSSASSDSKTGSVREDKFDFSKKTQMKIFKGCLPLELDLRWPAFLFSPCKRRYHGNHQKKLAKSPKW